MGLGQVQERGEQGLEEEQGYWEALNFQVPTLREAGTQGQCPMVAKHGACLVQVRVQSMVLFGSGF